MDKAEVAKFIKEQRRKTEEATYNNNIDYYNNRRKCSSSSRTKDEPYEEPSNTIMIRGLPSHITEDDIKVSLDDLRANYIAVRLIKDRRTGVNKGIAFVEFIAVNDAKDLMEDTRGELDVCGYYGKLTYGYNVKEEVDRYDAEKTNSWRYEKPTNTVMLRGVSNALSDNEVKLYVAEVSKHVSDVRLIRDKKTGMSRGFGFVEFDSVAEAQRWMEYQQGYFVIEDVEMKLSYTSTRQGGAQMSEYFTTDAGDWSCARCGGHNFKRRDFCYKCHLSKTQSKSVMETIDGKDQLGTSPCNTLLLRDLDALTLEDAITKALRTQFNCNVKQCEIMRDDVTKVSRCFAFVEMSTLSEARRIVEYYENNNNSHNVDRVFELSGKAVTIDYAKNSFNTLITNYREALAKRFEDTYEPPTHETSNYDANAAAAVAQAALNQKKLHKKGGPGGAGTSTVLPANVTVEGRASESNLCFELIVNGQRCTSVPTNAFIMQDVSTTKFVTPDTSKFLYDQSTQYYFDPVTGLYYDTNSQYFFDRMSQKYVYWDESKKTYMPVDIPTKTVDTSLEQAKTVPKEGKKSKASEAKKIAKEMEKWEKMMNSKKDTLSSSQSCYIKKDNPQQQYTCPIVPQVVPEEIMIPDTSSSSANCGFSMFAASSSQQQRHSTMNTRGTADDLVAAAYNSDSDGHDDDDDNGDGDVTMTSGLLSPQSHLRDEEEKLINWEKVACLLCNRGFKDRGTLEKHRTVSELHKKNLEQLKERLGIREDRLQQQQQMKQPMRQKYRDRAKERREKFGVPSSPPSSSSRGKRRYEVEEQQQQQQQYYEVEEDRGQSCSTVSSGGGDSGDIGSRLMAKMGWQQGQGLGKMNQGRTELVQAEFIAKGAGIGAAPRFSGNPSDNYRENLKRAMYAKYHDQ